MHAHRSRRFASFAACFAALRSFSSRSTRCSSSCCSRSFSSCFALIFASHAAFACCAFSHVDIVLYCLYGESTRYGRRMPLLLQSKWPRQMFLYLFYISVTVVPWALRSPSSPCSLICVRSDAWRGGKQRELEELPTSLPLRRPFFGQNYP